MDSKKEISTISATISNPNNVKFEEAMNLTGFGWYNFGMTVLCGGMAMAIVLETIGFSYILPASQCDLELTLTQKGWVGAIPFIGLLSSSHIWGYMADTRGRRKVLITSMLMGSTCAMLSSFSPNLATFAVLRLGSSALMSAANSVIFPYYGEFTPKKYLDSMVSLLSSIILFSAGVSALIAWGVLSLDFRIPIPFLGIDYRPWRLMVVCFAFPFMLASLGMMGASESPKFQMSRGKSHKTLEILKTMYAINTGNNKSTYPVQEVIADDLDLQNFQEKNQPFLKSIVQQTVPLFKMPLLKYMFIFCVLTFGMYSCSNAFFLWMPDIIDRFYIGLDSVSSDTMNFCDLMNVRSDIRRNISINLNETTICDDKLNSSTFKMMIILTCITGSANILLALSLRFFAKRTALLIIFAGTSVSALVMHWIYNPWASAFLVVIIQFCAILTGVVNAYTHEVFPTNLRAMAMCLILMFGRIGSVVGTNVLGLLMEVCCPANFFGFGILLAVCCLVCLLLPKIQKSVSEKT